MLCTAPCGVTKATKAQWLGEVSYWLREPTNGKVRGITLDSPVAKGEVGVLYVLDCGLT